MPGSFSTLFNLSAYTSLSDGECTMLTTTDGIHIRTAKWPVRPDRTASGSIFLLQGYTEFIEKYYEVIESLRDLGYAVFTFDWRGQGGSSRLLSKQPLTGYVESFSHFISDAIQLHEQKFAMMPRPHILMAHSMGGHLGLRLLEEHPELFTASIFSAPMLGWTFPMGLVRNFANLMNLLGFGKFFIPGAGIPDLNNAPQDLTSDLYRLERNRDFWRRTPELMLGGPSWRWLYEALISVQLVMKHERIKRLNCSVLLLSAGLDTVVSPTWHLQLGEMNPLVKVVNIPTSRHELFQENDTIQVQIWDQIKTFLRDAPHSKDFPDLESHASEND